MTRTGVTGVQHATGYHATDKAFDGMIRHDARQLSREDVLKMYTPDATRITFTEQQRGSLQAGKLTNFTVPNQDIMAIPAGKLRQTESLLTFVDGQQAYLELRVAKKSDLEEGRGLCRKD